jgi:hypothetical protein
VSIPEVFANAINTATKEIHLYVFENKMFAHNIVEVRKLTF